MRDAAWLRGWCDRADGGPYGGYRELRGRIDLGGATLQIDRIQPDPFAGPSRLRLFAPWNALGIDPGIFGPPDASTDGQPDASPDGSSIRSPIGSPIGSPMGSPMGSPRQGSLRPGGTGCLRAGIVDAASARVLGLRDFVGRWAGAWLAERAPQSRRGRGLWIVPHGQAVLDRSCVLFHPDQLEIRLQVELPARGRRILGREAADLLVRTPRALLAEGLSPSVFDQVSANRHADGVEDFAHLQGMLSDNRWVAFIADGSRLARRAGNDDRPLLGGDVVPFESPETLRTRVSLPHAGEVRGMAIPDGVTLLCGGGFHGKSTVLRAVAAAIVPHVSGDGRERTATRVDAQAVRAEDGRAITRMDLRPFLDTLPHGHTVEAFSTENASGSTSQAASILEALEGGCRLLLVDEDTSATNFMIRDAAMAQFLQPHQEPIRCFTSQARVLYEGLGVSSILVIGGSGEPLRVADRVLVLDSFRTLDRTEDARALVARGEWAEGAMAGASFRDSLERFREFLGRERPLPEGPVGRDERSLRGGRSRESAGSGPRVRATGVRTLLVDRVPLELNALESLRDLSQARFLADVVAWRLRRGGDGELSSARTRETIGPAATSPGEGQSPADLQREFEDGWRLGTFDRFGGRSDGDLAAVRCLEVLAAVCRLRSRPRPEPEWGIEGPGPVRKSERSRVLKDGRDDSANRGASSWGRRPRTR